jgi:hypothetical protein
MFNNKRIKKLEAVIEELKNQITTLKKNVYDINNELFMSEHLIHRGFGLTEKRKVGIFKELLKYLGISWVKGASGEFKKIKKLKNNPYGKMV